MGRSTKLVSNPAVKTFKWKNEKFDKKLKAVTKEAGWYYWDKSLGEGGEEVQLKCPARLMWLESMQSVTGYSKKEETGIYSNEIPASKDAIKDYGKHDLQVIIGNETVATGSWNDIKEEVKGMGGKYCIAVYGTMLNEEGEYEVVRFLFAGSSRNAWMDLADRDKLLKNAVVITGTFEEIEMKTTDTYQAAILKLDKATAEEIASADILYDKVEEFFKFQFSDDKPKAVAVIAEHVEEDGDY